MSLKHLHLENSDGIKGDGRKAHFRKSILLLPVIGIIGKEIRHGYFVR